MAPMTRSVYCLEQCEAACVCTLQSKAISTAVMQPLLVMLSAVELKGWQNLQHHPPPAFVDPWPPSLASTELEFRRCSGTDL